MRERVRLSLAAAAASVAIATPALAQGQVFVFCSANRIVTARPPVNVSVSVVYVSPVFEHRLEAESIASLTSRFRSRVQTRHGEPIGATCQHSNSYDRAYGARVNFMSDRRANGDTVEGIRFIFPGAGGGG